MVAININFTPMNSTIFETRSIFAINSSYVIFNFLFRDPNAMKTEDNTFLYKCFFFQYFFLSLSLLFSINAPNCSINSQILVIFQSCIKKFTMHANPMNDIMKVCMYSMVVFASNKKYPISEKTNEINENKMKRTRTSLVLVKFRIGCNGSKPIVW